MMFDWKLYNGNLTWLPERTILMCKHGSHCYGTSLPTSDDDYRGIAIAPRESYLLGGEHRFEQHVQNVPDVTVFELRKFVLLTANGNPNFIDLLFVDDTDRLVMTPAAERLINSRDLFLSRKIFESFSECAMSQLRRMGYERKATSERSYNWRQAMHSVRIMRMCREILDTGQVNVRRKDAEELLAIRAGTRDFDELCAWAENERSHIQSAARKSWLPAAPDFEAIDRLCVELISEAIQ